MPRSRGDGFQMPAHPPGMSHTPDTLAAIETHRRANGQFGEQHRGEAVVDDIVSGSDVTTVIFTPPVHPDWVAETKIPFTAATQQRVNTSLPHPTGGYFLARQSLEGVEFLDREGRRHRLDGPALVSAHRGMTYTEAWLRHGKMHRTDGPARTAWRHFANGQAERLEEWFDNGVCVRVERTLFTDDEPAGPAFFGGEQVTIRPTSDAVGRYSHPPQMLPWQDRAEVEQAEIRSLQVAGALNTAASVDEMADAVDAARAKYWEPASMTTDMDTVEGQRAEFEELRDSTQAAWEILRASASECLHGGFDRAADAQRRIDANSGWLGWLPARKRARVAAEQDLKKAEKLVAAAGDLIAELEGDTN